MLSGFNHLNLSVKNLNISFKFYQEILGLKPLCRWQQGAYLLVGNNWLCLNLVENYVNSNIECDYTHYAFSTSTKNFTIIKARLINNGYTKFKDNHSEGDSYYFLDPDKHKLEIHVGDWESRIRAKKLNPGTWQNIEFFI